MITIGQLTGISQRDSHPRLWMTSGESMSTKSARMTWHLEWMPCLEKFSEKAYWASSSQNWIWEGVGLEEEDASKRRGFRDGANLRLGAIDTTNVNWKIDNQKSPKKFQIEYVCMGNAWTCDMQNKIHHGLNPIQPYQHTNNLHTSKCMIILL